MNGMRTCFLTAFQSEVVLYIPEKDVNVCRIFKESAGEKGAIGRMWKVIKERQTED